MSDLKLNKYNHQNNILHYKKELQLKPNPVLQVSFLNF